mgnify:CR=1 FL=1
MLKTWRIELAHLYQVRQEMQNKISASQARTVRRGYTTSWCSRLQRKLSRVNRRISELEYKINNYYPRRAPAQSAPAEPAGISWGWTIALILSAIIIWTNHVQILNYLNGAFGAM